MQQDLTLRQELRQVQTMTPQQIQSLELLMAPVLDLEARINQELETNPALERLEVGAEQLIGNPLENSAVPEALPPVPPGEDAEREGFLASILQLGDALKHAPGAGPARAPADGDEEERRQFLLDSLTTEKSLEEDLLEQLRMLELDERSLRLAELIVGSLDEAGYLRQKPLADLVQATGASPEDVRKHLKLVQSLDPPGIGARDLRECLLLQLERQDRRKSLAYRVIDRHLEDLGRNRIPEIARALRVSLSALGEALAEIRQLQPRPGAALSKVATQYVLPEVTVEQVDGVFKVLPRHDCVPRLRVSATYLQLLEDPDTPPETKAYIREKVQSAGQFIRSLAQRQSTIVRIAEQIVARQREFLARGDEAMHPLTMGEVAEAIDVHETTVSRAIAGKFIATPRGVFPLRRFFTGGYQASDGELLSSVSVKSKLKALVSDEDPHHPLSDQQLVAALQAQGLEVARRTVAKYREELGISSTRLRRQRTGVRPAPRRTRVRSGTRRQTAS